MVGILAKKADWAVFVLLTAVTLAGCSQSPNGGPQSTIETAFEDVVATETRGVIKGVVVDEAIRPLADVEVELKDQTRKTVTTKDGLFSFIDLVPGAYFVQASKYGYNSTLTSVQVQAGVDPPIVNVPLIANPSERPHLEIMEKNGFLTCGIAGLTDICGLFGGGFFLLQNKLENGIPSWIQTELVWKSTQPASEELKLMLLNETDYSLVYRKNLTGTSPIVGSMNADEIAQHRYGIDSEYYVMVSSADVGVAVNQAFTTYTHIFYGFSPPADWQFSRDGHPRVPES